MHFQLGPVTCEPEADTRMPQGPLEQVYKAALSLGIANQLTNILRDVGEDSNERDRCGLAHTAEHPMACSLPAGMIMILPTSLLYCHQLTALE